MSKKKLRRIEVVENLRKKVQISSLQKKLFDEIRNGIEDHSEPVDRFDTIGNESTDLESREQLGEELSASFAIKDCLEKSVKGLVDSEVIDMIVSEYCRSIRTTRQNYLRKKRRNIYSG